MFCSRFLFKKYYFCNRFSTLFGDVILTILSKQRPPLLGDYYRKDESIKIWWNIRRFC